MYIQTIDFCLFLFFMKTFLETTTTSPPLISPSLSLIVNMIWTDTNSSSHKYNEKLSYKILQKQL